MLVRVYDTPTHSRSGGGRCLFDEWQCKERDVGDKLGLRKTNQVLDLGVRTKDDVVQDAYKR